MIYVHDFYTHLIYRNHVRNVVWQVAQANLLPQICFGEDSLVPVPDIPPETEWSTNIAEFPTVYNVYYETSVYWYRKINGSPNWERVKDSGVQIPEDGWEEITHFVDEMMVMEVIRTQNKA